MERDTSSGLTRCFLRLRFRLLFVWQRIAGKDPLLDRLSVGEMLLNEQGNAFCRHSLVPGPFRVDDHDWSSGTNSQTVHLGSVACIRAGRERKVAILQLSLKHIPRGL